MAAPRPVFTPSEAAGLDATDPLRRFRDEFVVTDPDLVYLDGHSLGRLPARAVAATRRAVEQEWADELVRGWERWLDLGRRIGDELAPLIGAAPGEVALCDQTGINLYKLAVAALDATGRTDVVTDAGSFPTDRYIVAAAAAARGGSLRVVAEDPEPAEVAAALDGDVGVVALSHVAYRSGAILDMAAITAAAHEAGAFAIWDLAHAAGAVPVDLAGCGVELAVGCTYKYLNGGPGAPGYLFVAREAQRRLRQPIPGWFGHADQFAFAPEYAPAPDLRRFLVGTPAIISMVAARAGISVSAEAGIAAIRAKGISLTERFVAGLDGFGAEVVSPRDPIRRGSHVAVRHPHGRTITQALRDRKVIVDFRAPDLIRFGFAPLYNTYDEARRAAVAFGEVLESCAVETQPATPGTPT